MGGRRGRERGGRGRGRERGEEGEEGGGRGREGVLTLHCAHGKHNMFQKK